MKATVWTELVDSIHDSGHQLMMAVAGGSKAIGQLLEQPGGSRVLLEAVVPYSSAALEQWLGGPCEKACCDPTARAMAMAAWTRARALAPETNPHMLIGLAATASLSTNRLKRGDHRIYVACQTANRTFSVTLVLQKGHRERKKEEWLAAKLLLVVLGKACNVHVSGARQALLDQLENTEKLRERSQHATNDWTAALLGHDGPIFDTDEPPAIFPGSFNPPHAGHSGMAQLASKILARPVAYEIAITNVDKPPLDFVELHKRCAALKRFEPHAQIVVSNAPTFVEKSASFPGCTFVVGVDTLARIAEPRYYPGGEAGLQEALQIFAERGCRFLVFGRRLDDHFFSLGELTIPDALRKLCQGVPEKDFREDVSSTEIRE